jgi:VWFA-related protein
MRLLLGVLAASVVATAQQSQAPAQPQITFRTGADYIEVDAVVTDGKGQFIRDLKLSDFEVLEDRRPQKIDVFALVDIPLERADRPAYRPAVEPDVVTNAKDFEGRVYVLVLDANHVPAQDSLLVKRAARQFIQQNLGANDLAAVVLAQTGSRDDNREFTSSKATLQVAIDRFTGEQLRSKALTVRDFAISRAGTGFDPIADSRDPYAAERAAKARGTLDTIRRASQYMAGIRGRRKALILFSEGLDFNLHDSIGPRSSGGAGMVGSGVAANPTSDNSMTEAMHAAAIVDEMQLMFEAASRANVAIYSIDPRGVASETDALMQATGMPEGSALTIDQVTRSVREELQRQIGTLRTFSEVTGGLALVGTNDFQTGFRRIVEDNSAYYVLGYHLTNVKHDGKFHDITVRVKRPGVQVRARKGYYALRNADPAATPVDPTVALLNSPMPVGGLGLRLTTSTLKDRASANVRVQMTVELNGRDLVLDGNNKVNLSYVALDMSGKVHASGVKTMDLAIREASRRAVTEHGLRLVTELELPPGHYQLRLAAHDPSANRSGSVFWDLDVPDFTKPAIAMGNLILTAASAGRTPTSLDAPSLKDLLPGPPTASREFALEDTLAVFTEVYDNETSRPHTVDLSATIRADDGTQVFVTREERESPSGGAGQHVYAYLARIPLQDLAAGRFVLTVEARSRLGDKVTRELQFTIK